MLHTQRHGSALQISLFLNLVNLEERLMQRKNTSTCQGLEKCLGLGLSTSRLGMLIPRK